MQQLISIRRWTIVGSLWLVVFVFSGAHGSVLWPCDLDADCALVDRATCSSIKFCRCPAGYTFSANVTECISESLNGDSCVEDNQCSHMLTGSNCNGVCECADGFTYIRGRCKKLAALHENCSADIDCFFGYNRESVNCVEQRCQCADGFYQRSENICRRKSMKAGDACLVHQDCVDENTHCADEVCAPRDVGVQTSGRPEVERRNASTSFDQASSAKAMLLVAVPEKTTEAKDGDDDKGAKFGDACAAAAANQPCPGLAHSVCQLEQCKCKPGYFHRNGVCMAEIGEVADKKELCGGGTFDERTRKCVCQANQFSNSNLRGCVRAATGFDGSCIENSQCSPYGAAYCPGYEVYPRRCICHAHAKYDAEKQMCVPKKGLESRCTQTEECEKRVPNTVCQNELCACKPHFIQNDKVERCDAGVQATCEKDADCAPANSECAPADKENKEDKECQCKNGFRHAAGECLKEATEFEEECADSEQCKPLLGATGKCIDSKCRCPEHQQHTNGKCNDKKVLGESCAKSSECFVAVEPESVVCRNAVCSCQFGTNKDMAKLACRKSSSNRPSVLKVITLLLTAAAVIITGAALHDAYK